MARLPTRGGEHVRRGERGILTSSGDGTRHRGTDPVRAEREPIGERASQVGRHGDLRALELADPGRPAQREVGASELDVQQADRAANRRPRLDVDQRGDAGLSGQPVQECRAPAGIRRQGRRPLDAQHRLPQVGLAEGAEHNAGGLVIIPGQVCHLEGEQGQLQLAGQRADSSAAP